jgi:hypothetical protein
MKYLFVSLVSSSVISPPSDARILLHEKKLGRLRADHRVIREFAFDDRQCANNIVSRKARPCQQ